MTTNWLRDQEAVARINADMQRFGDEMRKAATRFAERMEAASAAMLAAIHK